MISRFFKSRLLLIFSIILFICFIIGYDYAVITSREPPAATVNTPVLIPGGERILHEDTLTDIGKDKEEQVSEE